MDRQVAAVKQKTEPIRWVGDVDGKLILIDQTRLPLKLQEIECRDVETVWEAIRSLRVRGAPAIGIAAAYGVTLGLQLPALEELQDFEDRLRQVTQYLGESRPTAVNLFWALNRIEQRAAALRGSESCAMIRMALLEEAQKIHREDRETCHAIGRFGSELLEDGTGVLTHCNAGGLATSEYGTALSTFFTAQDQGKQLHIFVDETRPLLQGSRLTAWELAQRGIDTTLICDSMAAQVMREGKVQAVMTGADRIAANGDTANKIGTYSIAVLAHAHGIPFYVAAPTSTFDLTIENGNEIPIEQRAAQEITHGFGRQTAPAGISVYNPAFDVTPASYIRAIITERGLIEPVTMGNVARVVRTSSKNDRSS